MVTRAVGVGVVGLGVIGRVHAANLATRIRGARLVVVADASAATLRRIGRLHDIACATYPELLEMPGVDAVVIATPGSTHPELVDLASAAGKHIFCEKPLATDVASAERAVAAARRAGVLLQVGFHRRFDRDFMRAKSSIDRGDLGEIYTFFGSMRDMQPPPPSEVAGTAQALLHDAACHDLDAARWLVGEIDEVTTFGATLASKPLREIGQIDHAVTVLRFVGGAIGTIDNSLASGYGFDCRCEVVGSTAAVRVDRPYTSNLEALTRSATRFERTATFLDRFADSYPRELASFVDAIRHGSDVEVSGEDGLAAVVLATAAQRSLETNRTVALRRTLDEGRVRYAIDEA